MYMEHNSVEIDGLEPPSVELQSTAKTTSAISPLYINVYIITYNGYFYVHFTLVLSTRAFSALESITSVRH